MFARALIVLLVVLNLGVAAWWALRAPTPEAASALVPDGVPRLRLASGAAPGVRAATAPATARAALAARVDAPLPADAVCHSFGPYADAQAAIAAQAALRQTAQRVVARARASGRVRGWRVVVPPLPTREQAVALAERIAAAGFSDYFVMRDGADANAIALGRYGGEDSARRREAELGAAGFAARAEPIGGGPLATWLDVVATAGFDAAAAQAGAAAPERREIDCATLR